MTDLHATAQALVVSGKGILAADESLPTIGKRFVPLELENTEENRRAYRQMLFTTTDVGRCDERLGRHGPGSSTATPLCHKFEASITIPESPVSVPRGMPGRRASSGEKRPRFGPRVAGRRAAS